MIEIHCIGCGIIQKFEDKPTELFLTWDPARGVGVCRECEHMLERFTKSYRIHPNAIANKSGEIELELGLTHVIMCAHHINGMPRIMLTFTHGRESFKQNLSPDQLRTFADIARLMASRADRLAEQGGPRLEVKG